MRCSEADLSQTTSPKTRQESTWIFGMAVMPHLPVTLEAMRHSCGCTDLTSTSPLLPHQQAHTAAPAGAQAVRRLLLPSLHLLPLPAVLLGQLTCHLQTSNLTLWGRAGAGG